MMTRIRVTWLLALLFAMGRVQAQDAPEAVLKAEQERAAAIGKAVKTAVAVFGPGIVLILALKFFAAAHPH